MSHPRPSGVLIATSVAAVAWALLTGVPGVDAAGRAASSSSRCESGRYRTLFANGTGLVQRKKASGAVYVCRLTTGVRVRLEDPQSDEVTGPFAITGHYVAYQDRLRDPDTGDDTSLEVLDYRRNVLKHSFALFDGNDLSRGVDHLVLKSTGRLAWLDCRPVASRATCGTRSSPYYGALERRVVRNGIVLDESPSIRLGSLRLAASGRSVRWVHGDRVRHAAF
jgi:hypothetical protein